MNFSVTWSPSIQSYFIQQNTTNINLQKSYLEALLLQEQNSRKIQTIYLQQKLLSQLSQSCSQIPTYVQPGQASQPFYSGKICYNQVKPIYIVERVSSPADQFKTQISHMLDLFVNLCGKENEESMIATCRAQYSSEKALLSIFDGLLHKYRTCAKNREDMVRFVLRKAMSSLRDSVRMKSGLSAKGASLQLCKKYFSSRLQELTENNIDLEDEDQVLNFLLPYKKNSRNKTANGTFITEIFASEAFYEDYLQFLEKIDDILEADNQKRSKKLVDFLAICAKEGNFEKIKSFKRLPWLQSWLVSVKDIAHELLNTSKRNEDRKKLIKFIN